MRLQKGVRYVTRRGRGLSGQKERGQGARRERERERGAGKGKIAGIRERLPNGPRLFQRKKIDMHDSRTRERAEEGRRGANGALLIGEQKDGERGQKKVMRRREIMPGEERGEGDRPRRTSLPLAASCSRNEMGDGPPGVRQ